MTGRGNPSFFLAAVLHNGLGRYVQQLQRLGFSLCRGRTVVVRRQGVRETGGDGPRPTEPRPCFVPGMVAEYLNRAVREENIGCKSAEITTLVQELADPSGLEVIRTRKFFHTNNSSIQSQWHLFTNKPTTFCGLRPRELQDSVQHVH